MCKNLAMRLAAGRPHRVVVLALDSVIAFELGLPHRFLRAGALDPGWPGPPTGAAPPYEVRLVTLDDGPVTTSAGYAVLPTHPNTVLAQADTIVVPGINGDDRRRPACCPSELRRLAATARPSARWLSICTGAFVLAALGKLDGREATTHWCHVDALPPALPAGPAQPRRALRRPRRRAHLGRQRRRHRPAAPRAAHATSAPRPPTGSPGAPSSRRGEPAVRPSSSTAPCPTSPTPAPVPTRAWVLEHLDEPISLVGHGPSCGHERAHLHPALPRGDRRDGGHLAVAGSRRPGPAPARDDATCPSTASLPPPASAAARRCASTSRPRSACHRSPTAAPTAPSRPEAGARRVRSRVAGAGAAASGPGTTGWPGSGSRRRGSRWRGGPSG